MQSKAEVIVSSDDTEITMGGGVSRTILRKGGSAIQYDARKKLPVGIGDVVVSTAGALELQKYIFHCITLLYDERKDTEAKMGKSEDIQTYILQHSIDKCFSLLHALEINSIAFPCIGAGAAHFPIEKVAEVMADAISANLIKTQKAFNIELYLFDRFNRLDKMNYIDIFENFAVKAAFAKHRREVDMKMLDIDYCNEVLNDIEMPKREDMKHKVFISYSRKDEEKVKSITNVLKSNNIDFWIDKNGIFSGENYKEVIVDAIDCSKVVVFVSSTNSNLSINVVRELGYAVKQDKRIIPILLDDAQYAKSIRLDIADIDQLDFTDTNTFESKFILSLSYALDIR